MPVLNEAKTRYEIVIDKLREEILSMPSNGKLPSIRSLMERFSVSQATLDRSLNDLCQQGVIERINGRGYFRSAVAEETSDKPLRIDFCYFLKKEAIHSPLNSMITSFLQQEMYRRNCFTTVSLHGNFDPLSRFQELVLQNNPNALILMGCMNANLIHMLQAQRIPNLQLFPNCIEENAVSYIQDNRSAMEQIIDHLFRLGHRRIAFLHGQGGEGWYMLDQQERIEAYYDALQARDLPLNGYLVRWGGFSRENVYKAAHELLSLRHDRPTAIIGNDYSAPGIYQVAEELGLKIPEDLSVVGYDGTAQCELMRPTLTSLDICLEDTMRHIIDHAIQMAQTGSIENGIIRTKVALKVGNSTGPAPQNC